MWGWRVGGRGEGEDKGERDERRRWEEGRGVLLIDMSFVNQKDKEAWGDTHENYSS